MQNRIHPTAIIGEGVELGQGNVISPYAVIVGPCRIGNDNFISPHVSIGGPAEHREGRHPAGWESELAVYGVEMGDRNVIREYTTINSGFERTTVLGCDCYIMSGSHVGHDCVLEDGVTITSAVRLAGHCHIWTGANLGMNSVVHQRLHVGPGAMVGMQSAVTKDVGPFALAYGVPARTTGLNKVGLSRWGCDDATIAALEPYLCGHGEAPRTLAEDVASALKRWAARSREH